MTDNKSKLRLLSPGHILSVLSDIEKRHLLPLLSYQYALRVGLILSVVALLGGCSVFSEPEPEKYKIIKSKPIIKTKVVVKTVGRSCPALPPIADNATPTELTEHHRMVIIMYKRCVK